MADSTCESEYIAACEASKEAIWMMNFIGDLRVVPIVQDPIEIFCDNESVVSLTKETKDQGKSKHIERKYHFIRSKVEEGHEIVKDIRSEDNLADLFTKALAKSRHDEHAKSIGLKDKINSAVALDRTLCLVDQDRLRPIIVNDLSKWETIGFSGIENPSDTPLIPAEKLTIPHVAPTIQYTSPFIYTNSSDSDTPDTPPSPTHDIPPTKITPSTRQILPAPPDLPHHFALDDSSPDSLSDSASDYSSDTSLGYSIPDCPCDSPAAISARPSRQRCRSPTTSVPVATPVSSDESYEPYVAREVGLGVDVEESYEPYSKLDINSDVQADIDARIAADNAIAAKETDVRVEVRIEAEEEAESSARGTELYDHMIEIPVKRIAVIEGAQRSSGYALIVASEQRVELLDRTGTLERDNMRLKGMLGVKRQRVDCLWRSMSTMSTTRSGVTIEAIKEMIARRVAEALENYDANINPGPIVKSGDEQEDENGDVSGDGNRNGGGNGNGNGIGNGGVNGNRNGNGNGNGNLNMNFEGFMHVAREYTHQDFLKCQPLNFKGTEGVVSLTRWFEKMETVFHISNYLQKYQVKYATYTLQDNTLTWLNSHKRTFRADATYVMTWKELMKLMTEFQKLVLLCTKMIPKEEDMVEKFIEGQPDNIQGNVITVKPTRLQDAICIANNWMDQKLKGYAARNAKNKRMFDNNPRDNHGPQPPPSKRQNVNGQNVV
ncbi:hypothetical protein Tco_1394179 [Tanacetum coccineum]